MPFILVRAEFSKAFAAAQTVLLQSANVFQEAISRLLKSIFSLEAQGLLDHTEIKGCEPKKLNADAFKRYLKSLDLWPDPSLKNNAIDMDEMEPFEDGLAILIKMFQRAANNEEAFMKVKVLPADFIIKSKTIQAR